MSTQFIISNIAKDLELNDLSVKNTVELFEDGATIPFINCLKMGPPYLLLHGTEKRRPTAWMRLISAPYLKNLNITLSLKKEKKPF